MQSSYSLCYVIFRNIFDGFDRIDGKPTRAELKAQMQAQAALEEKRKKQEVRIFLIVIVKLIYTQMYVSDRLILREACLAFKHACCA